MEYVIKEMKDGTRVTVRDMQLELLEMMKEIDKICRENNIEYFIDGGSTLGAVRHQGFIPWDDDIDIALTRDNYKKLIKALDKDLDKRKYTFHCYEKNKKYNITYGVAMKIRKKGTYIKELNKLLPNRCNDCDGIFIDVFIYEKMSKYRIIDIPFRLVNTLLMGLICTIENLGVNPIPLKSLYRFNAIFYGKVCRNSKYVENEIIWVYVNPFKNRKHLLTNLFPVKYMKFEDIELPVPNNCHAYLSEKFGPTYMTPPPENKRIPKHTYDINLKSDKAE